MSFTQNYEESWQISNISSIDLIRFGSFFNLSGVLEKTSFSNRETSAQTIGLSWSLVAGVIPAPSLLIQPTRCQCLSSCFTPATTIITYTLKGCQLPLSRKNRSFQETRITASHDFLLGSFRNATTWKCKKKPVHVQLGLHDPTCRATYTWTISPLLRNWDQDTCRSNLPRACPIPRPLEMRGSRPWEMFHALHVLNWLVNIWYTRPGKRLHSYWKWP